jgi:imidazolonepropionase-like amidohydrolase
MFLVLLTVNFLAGTSCRASDLALIGAKIYPSPTEPPIENGSILVHQGQIRAIGPTRVVKIPRGATIIDCKGLIVTAGFWNSHVHVFTPGLLHVSDSTAAELDEQLDAIFNRWGFTTVFDLGSVLDNTLILRRRIESGAVRGPRILTVGEPIWTIEPVYVRDYMRDNNIDIPDTKTPDDAIALVRDHIAKGADGIKLFTGSLQDRGKVAALPLAIAKAAVEEAHRHGMPVFAHPQNLEGAEIAITSGVDVLAHTVPDSPPWSPEFVARLKKANLALIPTLTLWDFEARKIQGTDQERVVWIDKMVAELGAYSNAGGEVLFGTDIGYTDHFDTTLEFTLMSRAGMTYRQILASLTTDPARLSKSSGHSGRIANGMDADLVILGADPAHNVTGFSNVRYVIRSGKLIFPRADLPVSAWPMRGKAELPAFNWLLASVTRSGAGRSQSLSAQVTIPGQAGASCEFRMDGQQTGS